MDSDRRLVILADGMLDFHHGKTATSILRYRPHDVVAVVDGQNAGRTAGEVLGIGGDIAIVAEVADAFRYSPTALLIGIAPAGGGLPMSWRRQIVAALERGIDLISGLHYMMGEDEEFRRAAEASGARIVDVRKPPSDLVVARNRPRRAGSHTVTFVGSDCAVGKMTASLEMTAAAHRRGLRAAFVATGQTGIMLEGSGIAIDRVIGDFMSGAAESLVCEAAEQADWVFVEGQGSLLHPSYSGVTLSLLHGSLPDVMVLVHIAGSTHIDEFEVPIPPLREVIHLYESAAGWVKPARVAAVALNTRHLTDAEAEAAIRAASQETGLPVADPVRGDGAGVLLSAVLATVGVPVP